MFHQATACEWIHCSEEWHQALTLAHKFGTAAAAAAAAAEKEQFASSVVNLGGVHKTIPGVYMCRQTLHNSNSSC